MSVFFVLLSRQSRKRVSEETVWGTVSSQALRRVRKRETLSQEVASYFGKIATTWTESVRFENTWPIREFTSEFA